MTPTITLTIETAQALHLAAELLATTPEALAERIVALTLQSCDTQPEVRRAGFSALCDLRGKLFVAGLPGSEESDA